LLDSICKVDPDIFYNELERAFLESRKLKYPFIVFLRDKEEIFRWFQEDNYFFVKKCFLPWMAAR